jgi:hypothetical protein
MQQDIQIQYMEHHISLCLQDGGKPVSLSSLTKLSPQLPKYLLIKYLFPSVNYCVIYNHQFGDSSELISLYSVFSK